MAHSAYAAAVALAYAYGVGLSNRACEQGLRAPALAQDPWVGVIPSFSINAGGLGVNLTSHETCEASRAVLLMYPASQVSYDGPGVWDQASEMCVVLAGHAPEPAWQEVRPDLVLSIAPSEPRVDEAGDRAATLLIRRLGLRYPAQSSVAQSASNPNAVVHTLTFDAFPAFGCCSGYELQAPDHASVCGLPAGVASYARVFVTPTSRTNESRTYEIPSVPCVLDGFQHVQAEGGQQGGIEATAVPTAVSVLVGGGRVPIPQEGGSGTKPLYVVGSLTPVDAAWGMTLGGLASYLVVCFVVIWVEVRWRKQARLHAVTPCDPPRKPHDK